MKKSLLILLLTIPFVGFGQNFLDTITINHKTNVLEISKKTELECEEIYRCDFTDWFGESIRNIIGFETKLYDELMNEYYNTMKSVIPEEDFIQIRDSQRSWLKSRDNTEQFIFSTIQKDGWMMLDRLLLLSMYKNRVSELLEIFELYSSRSEQDDYLMNIQNIDFKSDWRDHDKTEYLTELIDTIIRNYHKNGQLKSEEIRFTYDEDVTRIVKEDYNDNGQIIYWENMFNFSTKECQVKYYKDGKLLKRGFLINGLKNHCWWFYPNEISFLRCYEEGVLISEECWREEEKIECE